MMKTKEIVLICASVAIVALGADEVGITKDMPSVTIEADGKQYEIKRDDTPGSYLTNTYALTSRPSPPFFVQPFKVSDKVETYGELELLDFLKHNKGIFIDARLPNWYEKSAIPGAVNIPFKVFLKESPERDRVLQRLGVRYDKHGKYDFSHAKTILLYCNGAWCGQSPTAIKALMKLGYPEEKMKYYRGGMQAWQLLGLTTIVPQKDEK
jgi:rhodanese-related sulfurtransferase